MLKPFFLFLWQLPRNVIIVFLSLYQKILSPDHSFWAKAVHLGGYCKYHPTCSQYTKEALEKYGFWQGLFKGGYRVLRCNPWSEGGVDLP